ncbi:MAG: hypothetical protein Q4B30_01685 [Coriobacteriaceae bacterium]|nr:hypothetical protein [Coriobacteriaceae bacterium]
MHREDWWRARVSQMLASRQLDVWREGPSSYVTRDSLDAALGRGRGAGRPRLHEEE